MAITWAVSISVLDVATKAISVMATRTDSDNPANPKTYVVASAIIATNAQKLAVLNNIWEQHQAAVVRQNTVNTIVSTFEADARANLEARE